MHTPWQVGRPGWKLGGFERHLLTRISWHFAFFTTDGKSAVNQSQTCIDWRLTCLSPTYCARKVCD